MLTELKNLPLNSKIRLIGEFEPKVALDLISSGDAPGETEVWNALATTLKASCLQASASDDLAQALRNRLRQAATEEPMCIVESSDTDGMTELDLAYALVDYVLVMSGRIEEDDPFFRTKTADEKRAPHEVREAYEKVRDAFSGEFYEPDFVMDSDFEMDPDALKRVAGTAAIAPALAAIALGPIGAVAGAAFMAGMAGMAGKRAAKKSAQETPRASRARKSKLFQNLVKLSLFMVAAEAERTAGTDAT